MASDEVIETEGSNDDLLRDFFDFGDDLIMPDKPFDIKKESNDFHNGDFDANFGSPSGSNDFFLGATPSPSSSSSSSSSVAGNGSCPTMPNTGSSHGLEFAMSIANDFMNIDFSDAAAADVDIGNFDDELDIMSGYEEVIDSDMKPTKTEAHVKTKMFCDKASKDQKPLPPAVLTRENVQVYTDLNSPLTLLRSKLEKRFNINLTSYSIWLQDKIPLNDESTLSEQCVEGTGVVKVQLNIQPHNDDGHQKINIVDVLKVEPEISTVENSRRASVANDDLSSDNFDDDEDDDFFNEDEDVDIEDVAPESVVDHPVSNFVESVEFCQLRKRFKYPNSVSEWTRMHTVHWAKWVNRTFKGVRLNEENWNLDGRDFSAMSEDEFSLLVGNDPGNLLWSHFSLLRQTGMATVPSNTVTSQVTTSSSINKNVNSAKRSFDCMSSSSVAVRTAAAVPMLAKKQRVILGKYEEGKVFINNDDSSNVHRTGNNGNNVQLWKFLLDILTDYKHRNIIRWSLGDNCLDGEFVMSEPEGVARLWGQQKGKCTMNYEKLSRALRYYKGGNILDKVHNKKFTYRFVCDLRDIVGFSAKELDLRVREHVERASAAVELV